MVPYVSDANDIKNKNGTHEVNKTNEKHKLVSEANGIQADK